MKATKYRLPIVFSMDAIKSYEPCKRTGTTMLNILNTKRDAQGNILNSVVHLLTRPSENPALNINQDFLLERVLRKHPDVIGVGERTREGNDLYNEMKQSGVLSNTSLVYGQMTEPPGARMRVALSGLTMAEYFRDSEKQDVLLFIDNIFRFTQAGSEVSALLGRMPSAVGYQPTLANEMAVSYENSCQSRGKNFCTGGKDNCG